MRGRRSFTGFARRAPAIDGPKARAQAIQLLVGATDSAFAAITPEGLAASYRLSVRKAGELLAVAKARRETQTRETEHGSCC